MPWSAGAGPARVPADAPILYLLAIEDVVRSPLVRSQVLEPLKVLARQGSPPLQLLALYPVGNALRFRRECLALHAELGASGIAFQVLPLLFLTRHFHIPGRFLGLFRLQAWLAARWIARHRRPALVHARSYPAALVADGLRRQSGVPFLFDTRGLYPEEGLAVHEGGARATFSPGDFARWKGLERDLLGAAGRVAVLSPEMGQRYLEESQGPELASRLAVLPPATAVPGWEDLARWRGQARARLGVAEAERVVAYLGSWFEPAQTVPLFLRLAGLLPRWRWRLLVLVSSWDSGRERELARALGGLPFSALSLPQGAVPQLLAGADLALLPQVSEVEQPGAAAAAYRRRNSTVFPVKFCEYLGAGLPVLVDRRWAGAAGRLVEAERLGLAYDGLADGELRSGLEAWEAARGEWRERCWRYACANLSREALALRCLALYESMGAR